MAIAGVAYGFRGYYGGTGCGRSLVQGDVTSLATAVNQFHVEYGTLPEVAGRVKTDKGDGVKLLNILAPADSR